MNGHEVAGCFKLHGIPEWFKLLKEQKMRDRALFADDGDFNRERGFNHSVEKTIKEEIERCFGKLNKTLVNEGKKESVNMIGSSSDPFSAYDKHFAFGVVDEISTKQWILDSGASIHICCNSDLMNNVKKLNTKQSIYLPDGSRQSIEFIGTVQLTADLVLSKVFFAPSFAHNLVSVSQLAKDLNVNSHSWTHIVSYKGRQMMQCLGLHNLLVSCI